ncbi:EF-hand domain-containing protein [Pseudoxanthomonas sp. PXM03]|uniref:HvfA family oxazolone/thioamide-modified RiPP metallophore n=1 Tax=Pseudoxanthomonas sp. PXM03 TaxID=2769284 RepID=UPI00177F6171|nr:EF-hand domain-containing protein [Pseudoxanthomonas sp. PXM03]MBD9435520.1 EF-hand domain-containing protein [Pseudoxanthomonas sp. PXM03]
MSKNTTKPAAVAIALAGGILLAGSSFAMEPLAQGYLLAAPEAAKAGEGKCGEGKCGEGKCGMAKADTDKDGKVSQAEFAAAHPDKAGKFADIDTNKDGFIDAAEHKAHAGAKGAEGKCGEGKCGEGKCGADKKTEG